MKMKRVAVVAGLALGLMSGAAKAALFDFSYELPGIKSGTTFSASGTLTVTEKKPGEFLITGISGTRNGEKIIGLLVPGAYSGNDNLLFLSEPHLTFNGFSYVVNGKGDTGSGSVNFFSNSGTYSESTNSIGSSPTFNVSEVSSVPLPASAPMLGAGLIALGAAGYAAKRKQAASAA